MAGDAWSVAWTELVMPVLMCIYGVSAREVQLQYYLFSA